MPTRTSPTLTTAMLTELAQAPSYSTLSSASTPVAVLEIGR